MRRRSSAATGSSAVYGGATEISERHRHRYEVNTDYKDGLERVACVSPACRPTACCPKSSTEDHPWFIGVQFHPELKRAVRPASAVRQLHPGRGGAVPAGLMIGSRVAGTDLAQDRRDQIVGTGSIVPQVGACSGPHARRCAGLRRGAIDPTCGIRRRREFSDQRRALWSRQSPRPQRSQRHRQCVERASAWHKHASVHTPARSRTRSTVPAHGALCRRIPAPHQPSSGGEGQAPAPPPRPSTCPPLHRHMPRLLDLARVAGTRRDMCFSSAEPIALPRHPSAAAFLVRFFGVDVGSTMAMGQACETAFAAAAITAAQEKGARQ